MGPLEDCRALQSPGVHHQDRRLTEIRTLCPGVRTGRLGTLGTTDLNVENVSTTRTLLSCTLGLVSIDEEGSTVRLVHFTLQEYFAAHQNLFVTTHSMMAEICLTYLNFRSVCEPSTTLDITLSTTPFLHYASCYWGFHARKGMTNDVERLALQVLEQDGNHISADILLREESVDFMSWWNRSLGGNPNLVGILSCSAYSPYRTRDQPIGPAQNPRARTHPI